MSTEYNINANEATHIKADFDKKLAELIAEYEKHPKRYGKVPYSDLYGNWVVLAEKFAAFQQFESDGLAAISKESDDYCNIDDLLGDYFNPDVNSDIDPDALEEQKQARMGRINYEGVYFHQLTVMGEPEDSICGFVGDDFYGSGYDSDFYSAAYELIEKAHPEYVDQIGGAIGA